MLVNIYNSIDVKGARYLIDNGTDDKSDGGEEGLSATDD